MKNLKRMCVWPPVKMGRKKGNSPLRIPRIIRPQSNFFQIQSFFMQQKRRMEEPSVKIYTFSSDFKHSSFNIFKQGEYHPVLWVRIGRISIILPDPGICILLQLNVMINYVFFRISIFFKNTKIYDKALL
jgi:hypothetical protein